MTPDSPRSIAALQSANCIWVPGSRVIQYFFHITDGSRLYTDDTGRTCASRVAAGACAAQIARELAADGDTYARFVVSVADERGNELARIPIGRQDE
jgi:uncharacterized protein DUF6894